MFSANAYTSVDQLREWFFLNGRPLWTLYGGIESTFIASKMARHKMIENNSIKDMEKSWEILETQILASSSHGGEFTVRVDNHPQFKTSLTTTLRIVPSHQNSPHGIAGSAPSIGSSYLTQADLQREMEIYDLKRKNEDLEHELDAAIQGSPMQRLADRALESPQLMPIIQAFLGRILGPQVSMQGFGEIASEASTENVHQEDEQTQMIIAHAFRQIETVFPDVTKFMMSLGNWIEKNPEMAKSIFESQMMSQADS